MDEDHLDFLLASNAFEIYNDHQTPEYVLSQITSIAGSTIQSPIPGITKQEGNDTCNGSGPSPIPGITKREGNDPSSDKGEECGLGLLLPGITKRDGNDPISPANISEYGSDAWKTPASSCYSMMHPEGIPYTPGTDRILEFAPCPETEEKENGVEINTIVSPSDDPPVVAKGDLTSASNTAIVSQSDDLPVVGESEVTSVSNTGGPDPIASSCPTTPIEPTHAKKNVFHRRPSQELSSNPIQPTPPVVSQPSTRRPSREKQNLKPSLERVEQKKEQLSTLSLQSPEASPRRSPEESPRSECLRIDLHHITKHYKLQLEKSIGPDIAKFWDQLYCAHCRDSGLKYMEKEKRSFRTSLLKQNDTKILDLSNLDIGSKTLRVLGFHILKSTEIEELNLINNVIRDDTIKDLKILLEKLPELKILKISCNLITQDGMKNLTCILNDNENIQSLILGSIRGERKNMVRDKGLSLLTAHINLPNLQILSLADIGLTHESWQSLRLLLELSGLQKLNISRNKLKNEGVMRFFSHCIKKLIFLDISQTQCSGNGIGYCLQDVCPEDIRLKTLIMGGNLIAGRGFCKFIAPTIVGRLQYLKCNSCQFKNPELQVLLNELKKSSQHNIHKIDLSNNLFNDDEAATLLSELIRDIPSLKHLNASYNELGESGILIIADVLGDPQKTPSLQELIIDGIKLNTYGCRYLLESLENNIKLSILSVQDNLILEDVTIKETDRNIKKKKKRLNTNWDEIDITNLRQQNFTNLYRDCNFFHFSNPKHIASCIKYNVKINTKKENVTFPEEEDDEKKEDEEMKPSKTAPDVQWEEYEDKVAEKFFRKTEVTPRFSTRMSSRGTSRRSTRITLHTSSKISARETKLKFGSERGSKWMKRAKSYRSKSSERHKSGYKFGGCLRATVQSPDSSEGPQILVENPNPSRPQSNSPNSIPETSARYTIQRTNASPTKSKTSINSMASHDVIDPVTLSTHRIPSISVNGPMEVSEPKIKLSTISFRGDSDEECDLIYFPTSLEDKRITTNNFKNQDRDSYQETRKCPKNRRTEFAEQETLYDIIMSQYQTWIEFLSKTSLSSFFIERGNRLNPETIKVMNELLAGRQENVRKEELKALHNRQANLSYHEKNLESIRKLKDATITVTNVRKEALDKLNALGPEIKERQMDAIKLKQPEVEEERKPLMVLIDNVNKRKEEREIQKKKQEEKLKELADLVKEKKDELIKKESLLQDSRRNIEEILAEKKYEQEQKEVFNKKREEMIQNVLKQRENVRQAYRRDTANDLAPNKNNLFDDCDYAKDATLTEDILKNYATRLNKL